MTDYKQNLLHPIDKNLLWGLLEKNYTQHFYKPDAIPREINQVWLGEPMPDKYNKLIQTWKDMHPDWEYKLWTDDDIDYFGMTNRALFDAMDNIGAKSDIFRYEIIYRYGGLYIDTDFECIRSFDDFVHLDFFSGGGPAKQPHTFNGLFGARPEHPILKKIIDALSKKAKESVSDFTEIMKITGPDFFSSIVLDYMFHSDEKIVIFPEAFFYPFPMEQRFDPAIRNLTDLSKAHSCIKADTYCIHLWHTAWQEEKAKGLKVKARKTEVKEEKQPDKWHLKVPKIMHCYWGGEKMPFMRYMTIKSFIDQNPDWKVMFWYPKHLFLKLTWSTFELKYDVSCDDYLPELMKLPIKTGDVDFTDFGFRNNIPENYKSDFIRDHLLYICGGVWADTDIIFFKPITSLAVNVPSNRDIETFVCIGHYGHSNGFLMGAKESTFFGKMSSVITNEYNPNDYQSIGPTMYNKYFPGINAINRISPCVNMDMDVVYTHDAGHITELLDGTLPRFPEGAIGCHWYAGHPIWGKFLSSTNGGLTNLPDNIIGKLLKNAINFKR